MFMWLNRFNIWLAMGGQMNEDAINNGTILLLIGCVVAMAVIGLNKKIRKKFF